MVFSSRGSFERASLLIQMFLETLMRLTPPALALAAVLLTVSSVSHGQRPDSMIDARSLSLMQQGKAEAVAGRFDVANDYLETALAVDPRNRAAFLALADVAKKQGLPGKAIRLYREALLIEPNDVVALAGQGEALVAKGALTKARENLARVRTLCISSCPEQVTLAAVIEKGTTAPAMSAQQVAPRPVATVGTPN
jgi:tetratricopeptide (TPR) repeat protein